MRCARSSMVCGLVAGGCLVLFTAMPTSHGDELARPKNKAQSQRQESSSEPAQLRKARSEVARTEQALKNFSSNDDPFGPRDEQLELLKRAADKARATLQSLLLDERRSAPQHAIARVEVQAARGAHAAEDAIRAALEKPVRFEFIETTLREAVDHIRDSMRIDIQFDHKALNDLGFGTDEPITRIVSDISLRSALDLMLKELDLTWIVDHEVLLITTIDEASQRLTTEVYDVSDLLEWGVQMHGGQRISPRQYDYDSLIETITSSIIPNGWDEVGGPGSIEALYGTLVVTQTAEVHEHIATLLAKLRKIRDQRTAAKPAVQALAEPLEPADPQAMILRVYTIGINSNDPFGCWSTIPVVGATTPPGKHTLGQFGAESGVTQPGVMPNYPYYEYVKQLAEIIPKVIVSESWAPSGSGVIHTVQSQFGEYSGSLVVRNTESVHRQIEQFLDALEATPRRQDYGGGGFF